VTSPTLRRTAHVDLVSFGTCTIVSILLVPVMLSSLRPVRFGLPALIHACVGSASAADPGPTSTATEYVAEVALKDDTIRLGSVLKAAIVLSGAPATITHTAVLSAVPYPVSDDLLNTAGLREVLFSAPGKPSKENEGA